eukprot:gnl/TRDRNA2_/TRDRNA2_142438_c2_seq1.p1 gnl/TRDRNA2_/TRDRNA2_142438_c2~~gnl/TRDRNA2_/TRDRNA2_142438_c2_seq1.p1  ORF type:complete len:584 (+),score=97.15 gnl/TRDRNA2_/TRDRNA2_142438_c2_seq1:181-1752(+)
MENVEGTDLACRLARVGRMPEDEARSIFSQAAEALRHSHALGVVHRDFKPGNVLLEAAKEPGGEERVRLVDFGFSKDLSDSCTGVQTPLLGTKNYRAPEVRICQDMMSRKARRIAGYDGAKVDIFALGATLFEMLGGQPPSEGEEVNELSFRGAVWKRIGVEAKDLLLGLLHHDQDRRLSLAEVLEHPWLVASPPMAMQSPAPSPASPCPVAGPELPPAAFPDAPADSSAARIRAEAGGRNFGSPQASGGAAPGSAPGWGVVLSWLRAGAAAKAAREVMQVAGMGPAGVGFGRAPQFAAASPSTTPSPASGARGASAPSMGAAEAVCSPHNVPTDATGITTSAAGNHERRARRPMRCHIKWVTCAPRFASAWRFARGAAQEDQKVKGSRKRCAANGFRSLLQAADSLASDELGTPKSVGESPIPPVSPTEQKDSGSRPSVIGFVHASNNAAVDGIMVTVTHVEHRDGHTGGQWGFVSEVKRQYGFSTQEDAMRAAECCLLPPPLSPTASAAAPPPADGAAARK